MKLPALLLLVFIATLPAQAQSPWAHLTPEGHLTYAATPRGDHIADFSYAGYMAGGVALPTAPISETLTPSGADDTAALQSALDRTAKAAADQHETLALLLAPGTFHLSATITLTASNIVLRGSGPTKTTLTLTGAPHLGLRIGAKSASTNEDDDETQPEASTEVTSTRTTIAPNTYVPSGTQHLPVASAAGFAPGDTILITHPITPEYNAFMGMDHLVRSGREEHWIGSKILIERRIVSIVGNNLTLDVPLTDSYDPKFGGGALTTVQKITPPHRLSQVGIESLTISCPSVSINLTDPHFDGIQLTSVEDAWLRDLHLEETINSVSVASAARRITIDHVDIVQHSPILSPAKNFAFSLAGTQTLVMHSTVHGDKVFFVATQAREQGPNVVLYCNFTGDQSLEPHQRWGTGLLVDNVTVKGGAINFINRGTMGSGHGWTMGWGVVWNSSADTLSVQQPPGAINWAVGSSGQRVLKPMPISGNGKKNGTNLPEGTFDSYNHRVKPDSLYLQQLSDRLGPQSLHNIGF